jgi:hypothetical protein
VWDYILYFIFSVVYLTVIVYLSLVIGTKMFLIIVYLYMRARFSVNGTECNIIYLHSIDPSEA